MHLLDDQEHNRYHLTLVDWLPLHSVVDQWVAASQWMSGRLKDIIQFGFYFNSLTNNKGNFNE